LAYSIDTSALVDGWVRYYPHENFPQLWVQIEGLIDDGALRAPLPVLWELERQDDDLLAWAKGHRDLFVDPDEAVQAAVTELMDTYHDPDKPDKGIAGADPFVIAYAGVHNPARTIVSGEKPGTAENPKIPFVCNQLELEHKTFLGLIQEQGWQF
jgi:hypothetical protein